MSQVPPQIPPQMPSVPQTIAQPVQGGKGLAITSMVLGLVGLCTFVPGLVAIILGILSLANKRPGKEMAITGIITGSISVFILATAIAFFPVINRVLEAPRRASCMANLESLGQSLAIYTQDYDNQYPQSLDLLRKNGYLPKVFKCPSSEKHREFDYFYLAPAKDASENPIVACDLKDNHKGEIRNVLYMGGYVGTLNEPLFQQALARPENAAFAEALRKAEGP